jgi:hypothetical protein
MALVVVDASDFSLNGDGATGVSGAVAFGDVRLAIFI